MKKTEINVRFLSRLIFYVKVNKDLNEVRFLFIIKLPYKVNRFKFLKHA
jgi:hypothetical protein